MSDTQDEETAWTKAEVAARAKQKAVYEALGIEQWDTTAPMPDTKPPHWARGIAHFDRPDAWHQAPTAVWLMELGMHMMVGIASGAVGPAVNKLASLNCEEMAWTNDFRKAAGDDWDPTMPFFSEATLYPLVGKEFARTILALINGVKSATGS